MNRKLSTNEIEKLVLKIASPEDILKWSHGEVLKPETINYRTGKADRAGLFSEVIFGPMKDFECSCGKYKKPQIKGIVCEKCGVAVTHSLVRRERMGHITLVSPVVNILFLKVYPYPLKIFLDIPVYQLEKVIYYSAYIITKVNEAEKERIFKEIEKEYKEILSKSNSSEDKRQKAAIFNQIKQELKEIRVQKVLSDTEYFYLSRKYPNTFEVGIGAEPIRRFLEEINLEELKKDILKKITKAQKEERKYLSLKLKFINVFIKNKIRPEWMIFTVLPVIPPDLRPIVQLVGGKYTSSDLNDLYRRIINRNNRLKKLIELKTPEIILRNEKRMLQEAVDSLIDISLKKEKPVFWKKVVKSLADNLKGKEGRFRQNLLGKRVDYSGRSVIVVGPELKINECALPKEIAFEIFKPFVMHELLKENKVQTTKQVKLLIELQDPDALAALDRVIANKYVLLNRPPTLHKLSILAFKPILTEGLAIKIPPLVCEGYNADFDGDQMGVFLPLSSAAQKEAREILDASKNLLRPGTGEPIAKPQKDIIIGLYYLTLIIDGKKGENKKVYDENEAIYLYSQGVIDLQAKIFVKYCKNEKNIETSVGRIIFNKNLPADFPFVNYPITKKNISPIISKILVDYGQEKTAIILDNLKELGFKYVTISGLTLGIDDLKEPENYDEVINDSLNKHRELEKAYEEGWLSDYEKVSQLQEIWTSARQKLENNIQQVTKTTDNMRLMIDSGGRGSMAQFSQMVAIKGLVATPQGEIIELPILSSYKKGLTPSEYFISTHGARKGTADKALKTPRAGYLTRRLVDALHDVIVKEEDCGDQEGILIKREDLNKSGDEMKLQIYSRFSLEDIFDKKGNLLVKKGEIITKEIAEKIDLAGINEVKVRSPFTCKTIYGICQKCFGLDISNDKLVKLGEAVGIVSAQSIGEPGTQLTMRTFHYGGIVGASDITTGLLRVEEILEARTPKVEAFISPITGKVKKIETKTNYFFVTLKTVKNKEVVLKLPKKVNLLLKKGQVIKKGEVLNEGIEDPKKIYKTRGKLETFKYILTEVKKIYNDQGAAIHNKYLEMVIAKMFSRVKVIDPGDSDFIIDEIVEKDIFLEENQRLRRENKKPAKGILLFMGIKNIALTSYSFLSTASFQETTRALVKAALECRTDYLRGIKENIIIGRKPSIGEEFRKQWLRKKEQEKLKQEEILKVKD